tara:strand:- start:8272 stop:8997 length:726 start_codon:yes stop_codon:yes gene_type:complete
MIDYTLLVPASPKFGPLLNNLKNSYEKYRSSFANDMIIFGHDTRTSCYQSKMLDMLPMLESLSSEFIVVVDAFDLILNKPLNETLFKDFDKNPNLEFMFGAETNCFPYPEHKELFSAQARSTSLKYLNGGVIISKRERYIEVLKDALDPHKYSQHEFLRNSDQVLYTRLYKDSLEREDNKVVIDCEARISLQMFRLERDKDYTLNDEKQLTFLETGNIPFFVHFNGDGKNQMHHFDIEYGK